MTETDFANLGTGLGITDPMVQEGIVRNTSGLLSVQQNLFTIFLGVRVLDRSGTMAADQRAVAIVWRDPYPFDDQGHHRSFIRYFKWLTE